MGGAAPNAGHRALAARGRDPDLLITQNVDGLHEAAGSRAVALHGRISDVVCLDCRRDLAAARAAGPDGVAEPRLRRPARVGARPTRRRRRARRHRLLPGRRLRGLRRPAQADVVFFGENVPAARVQRSYDAVEALAGRDGALLVVGSSLTVMSGLRFVSRAARPASRW